MSEPRSFLGTVKDDGHLPEMVRKQIAFHLRGLKGEAIEISVRKHRAKRSSRQNARLWALYTVGAKSLGMDSAEECHDACAWKLLRLPDDERTGTPKRRRTPKLNTQEFTDYMDACERLLIEFGADLSDWEHETERIERAA